MSLKSRAASRQNGKTSLYIWFRSFDLICQLVRHLSTTGFISIKFHMPPSGEGEKVYIFGLKHMTKAAAMTMYGKNPKTSFSPESIGP